MGCLLAHLLHITITFRHLRAPPCQIYLPPAQVSNNLLINEHLLNSFTGWQIRMLIQQNKELTTCVQTLEDTIMELKSVVMGFSSQLQGMASHMLQSSSTTWECNSAGTRGPQDISFSFSFYLEVVHLEFYLIHDWAYHTLSAWQHVQKETYIAVVITLIGMQVQCQHFAPALRTLHWATGLEGLLKD